MYTIQYLTHDFLQRHISKAHWVCKLVPLTFIVDLLWARAALDTIGGLSSILTMALQREWHDFLSKMKKWRLGAGDPSQVAELTIYTQVSLTINLGSPTSVLPERSL